MPKTAQTAYEAAQDNAGRIEELVLAHLGLVVRLADRLRAQVGSAVSRDDLIGAGTLGLVEAAHRFDESRSVKFITFAYRRVQGAMVDHLRRNDWLGKAARERLKHLRRAIRSFRGSHHRRPSVRELADQTGLSERAVLDTLSYEKWDSVGSLDRQGRDAEGDRRALADLVAADAETPPEALEWKERVQELADAVQKLPERERQIIVMYYYEELYMAEMARVLGISESRVSQLHSKALYDLTRILEGEP